jgi:small subunit ribosomal protein S4
MSRDREPACKKCRRQGVKLFLKGERCHTMKCAIEKRNFPPGIRGMKRRLSEYGVRLREKQKLRHFYGVTEKSMRIYFAESVRQKGVTGHNLLQLFERRLDNLVFKAGITPSRKEARQLIRHNHFQLNGRKNNIPSTLVKEGDVLSLKNVERDFSKIRFELVKEHKFPDWIEYNEKSKTFTVKHLPSFEEIVSPVDVQLIVEYYSR